MKIFSFRSLFRKFRENDPNPNMSVREDVLLNGKVKGIELEHGNKSVVQIAYFGATVISYTNAENTEILFTSKLAQFDGSKPIRGGVPIVFPKFNKGDVPKSNIPQDIDIYEKMKNHGFARNSLWQLVGQTVEDSVVEVELEMVQEKQLEQVFPYLFSLRLKVKLYANKLVMQLIVQNKDTKKFGFQALLHTYLNVPENEHITVQGLGQQSFMDQVDDRKVKVQDVEVLTIDNETDRLYASCSVDTVVVKCAKVQVTKKVSNGQSSDFVIWNPWINKSKGMADFDDQEYTSMICVEPGLVSEWHYAQPGETWTLEQTIEKK